MWRFSFPLKWRKRRRRGRRGCGGRGSGQTDTPPCFESIRSPPYPALRASRVPFPFWTDRGSRIDPVVAPSPTEPPPHPHSPHPPTSSLSPPSSERTAPPPHPPLPTTPSLTPHPSHLTPHTAALFILPPLPILRVRRQSVPQTVF